MIDPGHQKQRNRRTGLSVAAVALGMVGLSYASVPLYNLYCRLTGFAGTTNVAPAAPGAVGERTVTVRFDANTDKDMPWRFKPDQLQVKVRIGEETLISYTAENPTARTITGQATFNVTPDKAGYYFNKIHCFCFDQQTLKPGEKVHMPVSFFIDPEVLRDKNMDDVRTITLSYTFFAVPDRPLQVSGTAR